MNPKPIIIIVVILVVAYFGYKWYQGKQVATIVK